jgi:hypothetical protein
MTLTEALRRGPLRLSLGNRISPARFSESETDQDDAIKQMTKAGSRGPTSQTENPAEKYKRPLAVESDIAAVPTLREHPDPDVDPEEKTYFHAHLANWHGDQAAKGGDDQAEHQKAMAYHRQKSTESVSDRFITTYMSLTGGKRRLSRAETAQAETIRMMAAAGSRQGYRQG